MLEIRKFIEAPATRYRSNRGLLCGAYFLTVA